MFLKNYMVSIILIILGKSHCQSNMWTFSDRVLNYFTTINLTSSICDFEIREYLVSLSAKEKWAGISKYYIK